MGLDKEVGSIIPAKAADIVAVKADPLADIRAPETMTFIMKVGMSSVPLATDLSPVDLPSRSASLRVSPMSGQAPV